jgi:hypothetical protein
MLPPFSVNVELIPEVDGWNELALADEDVQLAVGSADPLSVTPPPSNVEEVVVVELAVLDAKGCMLTLQFEPAAGLRPPGDSSVDPSGMLLTVELLVPLVPNVPNGEVAPMADVIAVCALAVPKLQRIINPAIIHCIVKACFIDRFMICLPSACRYLSGKHT